MLKEAPEHEVPGAWVPFARLQIEFLPLVGDEIVVIDDSKEDGEEGDLYVYVVKKRQIEATVDEFAPSGEYRQPSWTGRMVLLYVELREGERERHLKIVD